MKKWIKNCNLVLQKVIGNVYMKRDKTKTISISCYSDVSIQLVLHPHIKIMKCAKDRAKS